MAEVEVTVPETIVPVNTDSFHNPDFVIRYKGAVDFDGLYNMICKWMRYRKFKVYEVNHKFKPPEIEIELDGRRKKDAYKRDRIYIHFHMFKNKDVEVLRGDKVIKMIELRMKILFKSYIDTNYPNIIGWQRWKSSKFTLFLQNFFNKYIIKKEIDLQDSDVLYYELYELHAKVKEFLKLESRGNAY